MKPYSESSDQNKEPILRVLTNHIASVKSVLEIGSGTGQHAVYFADQFPDLVWHTSDLKENHVGIRAWIEESGLSNLTGPILLDVNQTVWPIDEAEVVFSANAVHIMAWSSVINMIAGIAKVLSPSGKLILYGPFNYNGNFTSESNASFDVWLKNRDPSSGIRDFEKLDFLANKHNMSLIKDYEMPANNRILVWQKM